MNWKLYGFLLLGFVFLLGCINTSYEQKVNKDGTSRISLEMDLTEYINQMANFSASSNESTTYERERAFYLQNMSTTLEQSCDIITEQNPDVTCTVNGAVFRSSKTFGPDDGYYTFEKTESGDTTIYTLVVSKIPSNILGGSSDDDSSFGESSSEPLDLTDPENAGSLDSYRAYDLAFSYIVEMPGEITSATAGSVEAEELSSNKVKFDLIDVMNEVSEITVVSEESAPPAGDETPDEGGLGGLSCLPSFALLALFGGAFFLRSRKV